MAEVVQEITNHQQEMQDQPRKLKVEFGNQNII